MANEGVRGPGLERDPSSAGLQLPIGRIELPKPNAKSFASLIDKEGMRKPVRHTQVHTHPEKMKGANSETRTPYSLCAFENIASWQEEPHRERLICASLRCGGGRQNTLRMDRAYSNISHRRRLPRSFEERTP